MQARSERACKFRCFPPVIATPELRMRKAVSCFPPSACGSSFGFSSPVQCTGGAKAGVRHSIANVGAARGWPDVSNSQPHLLLAHLQLLGQPRSRRAGLDGVIGGPWGPGDALSAPVAGATQGVLAHGGVEQAQLVPQRGRCPRGRVPEKEGALAPVRLRQRKENGGRRTVGSVQRRKVTPRHGPSAIPTEFPQDTEPQTRATPPPRRVWPPRAAMPQCRH